MPAVSKAQQRVMAIALHAPAKLRGANTRLADLPMMTLKEFAETGTRRLPQRVKRK